MKLSESTCKYCDEVVYFIHRGTDIKGKEIWACVNDPVYQVNHSTHCFKEKNYVPKFKVEDIVSVKWPNHSTVYKIRRVDYTNKIYYVKFMRQEQKKFIPRNDPIPIVKLDKLGEKDNSGIGAAIFD